MALKLRIGRRAAAQIEKADRWWRENRLAAPGALREDLDAAFSALLIQPGIGTKVANTKLDGVRRLHLGRVRYYVYYRVEGGEPGRALGMAFEPWRPAGVLNEPQPAE